MSIINLTNYDDSESEIFGDESEKKMSFDRKIGIKRVANGKFRVYQITNNFKFEKIKITYFKDKKVISFCLCNDFIIACIDSNIIKYNFSNNNVEILYENVCFQDLLYINPNLVAGIDMSTNNIIIFHIHEKKITKIPSDKDYREIGIVSDSTIYGIYYGGMSIFNIETNKIIFTYDKHPVILVAPLIDGNIAITSDGSGLGIQIWNYQTNTYINNIKLGYIRNIRKIGNYLVVVNFEKVYTYNLINFVKINEINHNFHFNTLYPLPNSNVFLSLASYNGMYYIE